MNRGRLHTPQRFIDIVRLYSLAMSPAQRYAEFGSEFYAARHYPRLLPVIPTLDRSPGCSIVEAPPKLSFRVLMQMISFNTSALLLQFLWFFRSPWGEVRYVV